MAWWLGLWGRQHVLGWGFPWEWFASQWTWKPKMKRTIITNKATTQRNPSLIRNHYLHPLLPCQQPLQSISILKSSPSPFSLINLSFDGGAQGFAASLSTYACHIESCIASASPPTFLMASLTNSSKSRESMGNFCDLFLKRKPRHLIWAWDDQNGCDMRFEGLIVGSNWGHCCWELMIGVIWETHSLTGCI